MKKFNFIIGKRQIMVATLLLILAIAAYLNWLAAGDQSITVMDFLNPKKVETVQQSNNAETNSNYYGETELVGSQQTTDYFNQTKLQKTASHAELSDELNKIIHSPETSDNKRAEATDQVLKLTEIAKKEESIENQVKSKFDDCVAFIDNDKVNVMVKTKEMTNEQAAQIKDIIINVTNVKPYNIVIAPME